MDFLAFFRTIYQAVGIGFVLLAIPLAFRLGGGECGLSFTFILSVFYFVLSSLRLTLRQTILRPVASLLYYTQFIVIPSLLIVHLSQCPVQSVLLNKVMLPWQLSLEYATGPFTILEGFCTLIIVQACGRAAASMARRSDLFLLAQVAIASLLISADIYLLLRIYTFPDILGLASATLIGAALTIGISLGVYGIWSRRGNVIECTFLLSYIVYQIYLTFTDFQPSVSVVGEQKSLLLRGQPTSRNIILSSLWSFLLPNNETWSDHTLSRHLLNDIDLPPVILANVTQFMSMLAELTPTGIKTMLRFLQNVTSSITPSIFMSLTFRMFSYLGAMRLVPYVKRQTPRHQFPARGTSYGESYNARDSVGAPSRFIILVYAYSPVLIIMVYTHLLLQHTGQIVHPPHSSVHTFDWTHILQNSRDAWQFWGWANIFSVLAIYAVELAISPLDQAPGTPASVEDFIDIS